MFGKKKEKNSSVAIDIGTQNLKIVEIEKSEKSIKLLNFKVLNLVIDGKRYLPKEISKMLKKALSEMGISTKLVKTSVSGKSLIVRHVELPKMTVAELKSSLKYQADLHIPYNLDEAYYDASIVENAKGVPENKMKALIVAIKKSDAEENLDILEKAGLDIELLTVDSIALFNVFESNIKANEKEEVIALIDIGSTKTTVNIVDKGESVLSRELKYGGLKFTEVLMEGLNTNFDDAEKKKISGNDIILPFVNEAYKPIIRDIRASFDYFEGMMGISINKLYLSGGGALSRGITDYFKDKLGIPCLLWNPLRGIDENAVEDKEGLVKNASSLTISIGTAISTA